MRRLDGWPVEITLVVVPEPAADADPEPILRESWALRDAAHVAAEQGLDFALGTPAPEPSRVRSVNASLLLERPGRSQLEAAVRLGNALFAGDGGALRRASRELGAVPGQHVGPMLEANYVRLRSAGHYQGGMLHYGGEWYWGVDRLPHLEQLDPPAAEFDQHPLEALAAGSEFVDRGRRRRRQGAAGDHATRLQ